MKKLEKYKTAPQVKFVKFKVKHFVEIPSLFDCLKSPPPPPPPLNVSPPWLLKFSSCKNHSTPDPRGGGEDTMKGEAIFRNQIERIFNIF